MVVPRSADTVRENSPTAAAHALGAALARCLRAPQACCSERAGISPDIGRAWGAASGKAETRIQIWHSRGESKPAPAAFLCNSRLRKSP
jgi:hypothetical protein